MKKFTYILISLFFLSCEDTITPELPKNDPILVVDAWVNDLNSPQKIFSYNYQSGALSFEFFYKNKKEKKPTLFQ